MVYSLSILPLLSIHEFYLIRRKTAWSQTYNENVFVIIVDGNCAFKIDETAYVLEKGDMLFIPEGALSIRSPINDAECEMCYIHFKAPSLSSYTTVSVDEIKKYIDTPPRYSTSDHFITNDIGSPVELKVYFYELTRFEDQTKTALHILRIAHESIRLQSVMREFISTFCLIQLLCLASELFIRQFLSSSSNIPFRDIPISLRKIVQYIRNNIRNQITLKDICNANGFSPQYVIRLFNQHLNTTPTKYINELKISGTKELIRSTDMSIKEIASAFGFDNPHYFSRVFKKVDGCYPTEFRNKFKQVFNAPKTSMEIIDEEQ